uniref:Uncharacterized protein n=1 Tax=Arundo donax TaxID=35708 RepID=A0A0A8XPN4_ARUDO
MIVLGPDRRLGRKEVVNATMTNRIASSLTITT